MFVDKIPVKFHLCHAHVGSDPEKTDAETYDSEKSDPDKADQKVKIPDSVAFHEVFALMHDLPAGKIRIIQIKKENLRIIKSQFQKKKKTYEKQHYQKNSGKKDLVK